jgi:hypothetical protein
LAKLAAEVERRRRLIEEEDHRKLNGWKVHLQDLVLKYAEWDDTGAGLHAPTLVAALRSFYETAQRQRTLPEDISAETQAAIKFPELPTLSNSLDVPVTLEPLLRELGPILEHCPVAVVSALADHISVCLGTETYPNIAFQKLFNELTHKPIRHKFLVVLQDFYDGNKDQNASVLTRPRALSFSVDGRLASCVILRLSSHRVLAPVSPLLLLAGSSQLMTRASISSPIHTHEVVWLLLHFLGQ